MSRVFIFLGILIWAAPAAAQDLTCEALAAMDFAGVTDAPARILAAQSYPAEDHPQAGPVPATCRVEGYIAPTIGFELRLPSQNWNGKFLFQGCGGFCGTLAYIERCMDAVKRGYACVTTDLGHKGLVYDATWAYNNVQAEIDFYYRATHATAQAGKAITEAATGRAPERSYFRGCSTGGRQGLVSAQRFPSDFDGIIVGAPAGVHPFGGLHLIWSVLANWDENGEPILRPDQLPPLYEAAVNACDADDGLVDGLIDDPRTCEFDPAVLQCPGGENCLSVEQVAAVNRIYNGPPGPDGAPLYDMTPQRGSEINWGVYVGTKDQPAFYEFFGGDFFRYLAFAEDPGPSWTPKDFDFERDIPRMGYNKMLNDAADPDLRAFNERGGKLLAYHGWADQSVVPESTIDYLTKVEGVMGGAEATSDFFRLFMLPGVGHCAGGDGPSHVDYLTALEQWVEEGAAPDKLIAFKPTQEPPYLSQLSFPLPADDVAFARPLFPYPDVARHTGGSPSDPDNFERVTP